MDLGATSKLARVTGSSAGISFATAEALTRYGAEVIVNGRTAARVEAAVTKLRKSLPRSDFQGIAADIPARLRDRQQRCCCAIHHG
jgi:NADP-dependent 3-hydroxy acid dehydrogenase YdfG